MTFKKIQEEHDQLLGLLQKQKNEYENELQKSQRQTFKKSNDKNTYELETQIKTMTERLIQQKSQIKNLKTEKSTMQLQVENLHLRIQSQKNENETESLKKRSITSLVKPVVQFDEPGFVRGNVVKAATFLDKITSMIAYFLVRYPLARVLLLLYAVFLHFYVFIVLNSWSSAITKESSADVFIEKNNQ